MTTWNQEMPMRLKKGYIFVLIVTFDQYVFMDDNQTNLLVSKCSVQLGEIYNDNYTNSRFMPLIRAKRSEQMWLFKTGAIIKPSKQANAFL